MELDEIERKNEDDTLSQKGQDCVDGGSTNVTAKDNDVKTNIKDTHNKEAKSRKTSTSIECIANKLCTIARKDSLNSSNSNSCFRPSQLSCIKSPNYHISPRKRILREMEKVSLQEVSVSPKRSRAKTTDSIGSIQLKNGHISGNGSTDSVSENEAKSSLPVTSSRISSYSITSLLSHKSACKRDTASITITKPETSPHRSVHNSSNYIKRDPDLLYSNCHSQDSSGGQSADPNIVNEMRRPELPILHSNTGTTSRSSHLWNAPPQIDISSQLPSAGGCSPFLPQTLSHNSTSTVQDYSHKYRSNYLSPSHIAHHPYQIPSVSSSSSLNYIRSSQHDRSSASYSPTHISANNMPLSARHSPHKHKTEGLNHSTKITFRPHSEEPFSAKPSALDKSGLPARKAVPFEAYDQHKIDKALDLHDFSSVGKEHQSSANMEKKSTVRMETPSEFLPSSSLLNKLSAASGNKSLMVAQTQNLMSMSPIDYNNHSLISYYQQMYAAAVAYHQPMWLHHYPFPMVPVVSTAPSSPDDRQPQPERPKSIDHMRDDGKFTVFPKTS